jgi:hypothetical protein
VLAGIVLASAPIIFYPVHFAMIFWIEHNEMPRVLYRFFDPAPLSLKVRLCRQDSCRTAVPALDSLRTFRFLNPLCFLAVIWVRNGAVKKQVLLFAVSTGVQAGSAGGECRQVVQVGSAARGGECRLTVYPQATLAQHSFHSLSHLNTPAHKMHFLCAADARSCIIPTVLHVGLLRTSLAQIHFFHTESFRGKGCMVRRTVKKKDRLTTRKRLLKERDSEGFQLCHNVLSVPPPQAFSEGKPSGKIIPVGTQALRGTGAGASRAYRAIVAWESVATAWQRTHTVRFAAKRRGDEKQTVFCLRTRMQTLHSRPECQEERGANTNRK